MIRGHAPQKGSSALTKPAASVANVQIKLRGRILHLPSIAVRAGEIALVLGPNGSGKTVLLDLLSGFVSPVSGSATLFGHSTESTAASRLRVRAFAGRLPLGTCTALDLASLAQFGPSSRTRYVRLLEQFAIPTDAPLNRLSDGEWQLASLAACFSSKLPLLLLDEPTTHLDVARHRQVLDLIGRCPNEGRTTIIASHDRQGISQLATRTIQLPASGSQGRQE